MTTVSDSPFAGDPDRYSDSEWQAACVLDKGERWGAPKARYGLPVREPDGALNARGLAAAAALLAADVTLDAAPLAKAEARVALTEAFAESAMPVSLDRRLLGKAALTDAERDALPDSDFIFPETRDYPYDTIERARDALSRGAQYETGTRLATIRRRVAARYPSIDVTKAEFDRTVPIWKDDAKQILYGVVMSPGVRDSQGDILTADDIEKAAHGFLTDFRKHDVQHDEIAKDANGQPIAETVESFIAPQDMTIAGRPVLKGAWVLATHIRDRETWQRATDPEHPRPLTGYSIGGSGVRHPEAA